MPNNPLSSVHPPDEVLKGVERSTSKYSIFKPKYKLDGVGPVDNRPFTY